MNSSMSRLLHSPSGVAAEQFRQDATHGSCLRAAAFSAAAAAGLRLVPLTLQLVILCWAQER
eukprot:418702-Pelagomonas_calceolata.AAC.3